jgi:hypothetical protein
VLSANNRAREEWGVIAKSGKKRRIEEESEDGRCKRYSYYSKRQRRWDIRQ